MRALPEQYILYVHYEGRAPFVVQGGRVIVRSVLATHSFVIGHRQTKIIIEHATAIITLYEFLCYYLST